MKVCLNALKMKMCYDVSVNKSDSIPPPPPPQLDPKEQVNVKF